MSLVFSMIIITHLTKINKRNKILQNLISNKIKIARYILDQNLNYNKQKKDKKKIRINVMTHSKTRMNKMFIIKFNKIQIL